MSKKVDVSKKLKGFDADRAQAVTNARQINNVLAEQIRAMEMEMKMPSLRKKYAKFVIKSEFKNIILRSTPPAFRPFRYLEFLFTRRIKRKRILAEMRRQEQSK